MVNRLYGTKQSENRVHVHASGKLQLCVAPVDPHDFRRVVFLKRKRHQLRLRRFNHCLADLLQPRVKLELCDPMLLTESSLCQSAGLLLPNDLRPVPQPVFLPYRQYVTHRYSPPFVSLCKNCVCSFYMRSHSLTFSSSGIDGRFLSAYHPYKMSLLLRFISSLEAGSAFKRLARCSFVLSVILLYMPHTLFSFGKTEADNGIMCFHH